MGTMPHVQFVPLRVFSCYTMLDGAIEPKAIAKAAAEMAFPAVALTDRNGLYASMAFSDACAGAGVQPIVGTMLGIARPQRGDSPATGSAGAGGTDWLALYAQDEVGYTNLCKLVSMAHLERPAHEDPHVLLSDLHDMTNGLLCLTAGGEGALARLASEGQEIEAQRYLDGLQSLFPDRLYIELVRRSDPVEQGAEPFLVKQAMERGLPLVATNPSCYVKPDFHPAHDAMLCIAGSAYIESDDRKKSSPEAWVKSAEVMEDIFSDIPEALTNTMVVAQRCAYMAPKRKPILPSMAGDRAAEAEQLRRDAMAGLEARLEKIEGLTDEDRQGYFDRLTFEVDIIIGMGFPGYFLIVADFIKWAKDHDIPVGPGRGSGAGSVVAWALTITDLDPLKLGLLFERFLNPERVSMPDFDIDFCETRRGEVIRYVQEKYGRDTVAQIITFGKLKARAVLKDTGRVLQMSYGQVDRLAKLVPNMPTDPWTLERALNGVTELATEYRRDPAVKKLFDLAKQLEGMPRHSSTHAAGVVIGDRPLAELVPLYRDPRSDMPVTQFDMKYVEGAGLVKFDFLGLKTLSVLKMAVRLLSDQGIAVDLDGLAWDDPAVYELLQRGETVGVFQLESEGMRRTLSAVKPTNFGDIIALVSLYRPGPMDNIPLFGARKNGREDIAYPHALLEPILKETYGIFVYQEQVMQAAQILADYSLGDADLLRRAMGKKIQAEMDAQRARFVEGCANKDITAVQANELFDLIDKFAGYGFNKSHAAAYALLAYQTAWLKAHYPAEFFAASMAYDIHQTDKLAIFMDDMRRLGVEALPPSINKSLGDFSVEPITTEDGENKSAVRYALGALKGVGEKAMDELVAERNEKGPFQSIDDFADRVDPRLLNRRQLESLAAAGAFDEIIDDRAAIHEASEMILAVASNAMNQRESGQGGLFGGDVSTTPSVQLPTSQPWTLTEKMAREKDAFGFYFSAHPVDHYKHLTSANGARTYAEIAASSVAPGARRPASMAGLIEGVRWRTSQRGKRYAMLNLSDRSGQFVASCFDEGACAQAEELAKQGACGMLGVELDQPEGEETPRIVVKTVTPFDRLSATAALRMEIPVDHEGAVKELAFALEDRKGGRGEIILMHDVGKADPIRIHIGGGYLVDSTLAEILERVDGVGVINIGPAR